MCDEGPNAQRRSRGKGVLREGAHRRVIWTPDTEITLLFWKNGSGTRCLPPILEPNRCGTWSHYRVRCRDSDVD